MNVEKNRLISPYDYYFPECDAVVNGPTIALLMQIFYDQYLYPVWDLTVEHKCREEICINVIYIDLNETRHSLDFVLKKVTSYGYPD